MATKNFNITKDGTGVVANGDAWNGGDQHHPIGKWDPGTGLTWVTRALLYAPISFAGMTEVTSAYLHVFKHRPASGWHAHGSGSHDFLIRRRTSDWSESSFGTSGGGENNWGGSGGVDSNLTSNYTSTHQHQFTLDCGSPDGDEAVIDITDIVQDWFNGSPNYGIMFQDTDESNAASAIELYARESSSGYDPFIEVNYSTNTAPNAPTSLSPTGDAIVNEGTGVTVSGVRSDNDSGDYITGYEIYVYADNGTTQVNHNLTYVTNKPISFRQSLSLPAGNTFYKWKARTRDKGNDWGPFSALQRFKANTVPLPAKVVMYQNPATDIKTLTPGIVITRQDQDSGDTMSAYTIIVETSSGTVVWNSGNISVAAGTVTVNKTYNGPALSWGTSYRVKARTKDTNGAWGDYSDYVSFATHKTAVPTALAPTGNTVVSSLTPTFNGQRATSSDAMTQYQIQLYANDGTTLLWDSGALSSGITSASAFSKVYNGTALAYGTPYKWRVRINAASGWSDYSALQQFTTRAATVVALTAPIGGPISSTFPTFTGTWTTAFNAVEIIVYKEDGVTMEWDSGQITKTSSTSFSMNPDTLGFGTELAWNTTYKWQARVRRSSDNVWQPYSGLETFFTAVATTPTVTSPVNNQAFVSTTATVTLTAATGGGESGKQEKFEVYEDDETTLVWVQDWGDTDVPTNAPSTVTAFTLVPGRTYKWRVKITRTTDQAESNWSEFGSFRINIAPQSPTAMTPETGTYVVDTLLPQFKAKFEDADITRYSDVPTKYEIEVYNNTTNALIASQVLTTGLIAGDNTMTWDGSPALAYNVQYKWRARYYDAANEAGAWSSFNVFTLSQSSNVTIVAPVGTIESPQVTVQWTFSSPSGRSQGSYRVEIHRNDDDTPVYDSGIVLSSATSHIVPAGYLQNNISYNFIITVVDTEGV